MPLPSGFKVNGSKTKSTGTLAVPPAAHKLMAHLNALPFSELLSTRDFSVRVGFMICGSLPHHPVLNDYHEKVDGKLLWGNKKSIRKLRVLLAQGDQQ